MSPRDPSAGSSSAAPSPRKPGPAGPLKTAARAGLSRLVVHSGLAALKRSTRPHRGALVFVSHRLTGDYEGYLAGLRPEWFDEQVAYIARHYTIISLSDLLRCFEEGRPVPDRCAVLTLDDGFRDNLVNGLPILQKHGVPATVFVVTGAMSDGHLPWPQRAGYLFQHTAATAFELPGGGSPPMPLGTPQERRAACLAARAQLFALSRVEREERLERLAETLGLQPPRDRMLSWADLRTLQAAGIEIGAHTFSHPWLALIPRSEAVWELERARDDLREQLEIERPAFCFPGGNYDAQLVEQVRALGFRCAFEKNSPHRVNALDTVDPFTLSRLGLPNAPGYVLEAEVDGPFDAFRRLLKGLPRWASAPAG